MKKFLPLLLVLGCACRGLGAANVIVDTISFTHVERTNVPVILEWAAPSPVIDSTKLVSWTRITQKTDTTGITTFTNVVSSYYNVHINDGSRTSFLIYVPTNDATYYAAALVTNAAPSIPTNLYVTTTTGDARYYPLASNPSNYLSSAAPFYPLTSNPSNYAQASITNVLATIDLVSTTSNALASSIGSAPFYPLISNPSNYVGASATLTANLPLLGNGTTSIKPIDVATYLSTIGVYSADSIDAQMNGKVDTTGDISDTIGDNADIRQAITNAPFYPLSSNPSNYVNTTQLTSATNSLATQAYADTKLNTNAGTAYDPIIRYGSALGISNRYLFSSTSVKSVDWQNGLLFDQTGGVTNVYWRGWQLHYSGQLVYDWHNQYFRDWQTGDTNLDLHNHTLFGSWNLGTNGTIKGLSVLRTNAWTTSDLATNYFGLWNSNGLGQIWASVNVAGVVSNFVWGSGTGGGGMGNASTNAANQAWATTSTNIFNGPVYLLGPTTLSSATISNLYSPYLEATNTTFVHAPTNSYATASQLLGTDANKVSTSIAVGSGLSLSGGTLSATGMAAVTTTNYWLTTTTTNINAALASRFDFIVSTNCVVTWSNAPNGKHWEAIASQDTNGGYTLGFAALNGQMLTNWSGALPTNASATMKFTFDDFHAQASTNIMASVLTNFLPIIALTNSLAGGGGACTVNTGDIVNESFEGSVGAGWTQISTGSWGDALPGTTPCDGLGTKTLGATTTGSGTAGYYYNTGVASTGTNYWRFYLYVDSSAQAATDKDVVFAVTEGPDLGAIQERVQLFNTGSAWQLILGSAASGTVDISLSTWYRVELRTIRNGDCVLRVYDAAGTELTGSPVTETVGGGVNAQYTWLGILQKDNTQNCTVHIDGFGGSTSGFLGQ